MNGTTSDSVNYRHATPLLAKGLSPTCVAAIRYCTPWFLFLGVGHMAVGATVYGWVSTMPSEDFPQKDYIKSSSLIILIMGGFISQITIGLCIFTCYQTYQQKKLHRHQIKSEPFTNDISCV